MCGCGCELIAAQAVAKADAEAERASTTVANGQPDTEWRGWWTELKALVHELTPSNARSRPMPLAADTTAPISGSAL